MGETTCTGSHSLNSYPAKRNAGADLSLRWQVWARRLLQNLTAVKPTDLRLKTPRVRLQLQVNELQKRLELELERHLCKICYEREIDTVILDCNHRTVCARCLEQVSTCPLCRAAITKTVQTFNA